MVAKLQKPIAIPKAIAKVALVGIAFGAIAWCGNAPPPPHRSSASTVTTNHLETQAQLIPTASRRLWRTLLATSVGTTAALATLTTRRLYREVRKVRRVREQVSLALDRERLFNQAIIETNPSFIVAISPEGKVVQMNDAMLSALGYSDEEVLGLDYLTQFVPERDRGELQDIFSQLLEQDCLTYNENRILTRNGDCLWVAWHGRSIFNRQTGKCELFVGIGTDISERKQTIEALACAEAKYRSIFENAIEGLFQLSPNGYYISANPALADLFGYASPNDLMVELRHIDRQLYVDPSRYAKLVRQLQHQQVVSGFEAEVYRRDGSVVWISQDVRAVRNDSGQLLYYEGSVVDITERKRTEQRLRYNASHDELTGLWNRGWFLSQVERSLRRARRHPNYRFCVLFLDLDNFKGINDSLGHIIGDRLLLEIAQRLELCLRPGDTLARLGGDEFTILMENLDSQADAVRLAQCLQQILTDPFHIDNHRIFTHASIGIAGGDLDYRQPQDLLQAADIALYRAKKQKSGLGYVIFDRGMRAETVRRLQLETDLRGAIGNNQLRIVYQPIVALDTLQVSGFEALVRWTHPQYGNISPAEFIPIAEESGSIQALGLWVLQTACQQLHQWQHQITSCDDLFVSVNLSGQQLTPNFIQHLDNVLSDSQLDGRTLKLEITETALMEDIEGAVELLQAIQQRQVRLCLDDFGTGYCSLNYLHRFPIEILKLDRSFVERLFSKEGKPTITQAILSLAQHLQIEVVAEGIETDEQLNYLQQLSCPYGQGYRFAKPLETPEATELLNNHCSFIAQAG